MIKSIFLHFLFLFEFCTMIGGVFCNYLVEFMDLLNL